MNLKGKKVSEKKDETKNKKLVNKSVDEIFDNQFFEDVNEFESNQNLTSENLKEIEKFKKLRAKILKKNFQKMLENDKLSKKVISARKTIRKKTETNVKDNEKRTKKANKQILLQTGEEKDIFLTIDKFNNNGKKTICYFIDSFYPCVDGVLSVMENYVKFMQQFYNVVVCAPKHKQKCYKVDDYFVLYSDSVYIKNQGYDLAFPQFDGEFQNYLSMLKIDLIHLQSPFNMGTFGLSLGKRRNVPVFITFHSQFKLNFYEAVKNETIATWLTKIVMATYEKSTLAITMNPFAVNIMREYGMKKPVEIIPNATNLVPKEFDEITENNILQKHGINKNKFNLIFLGRFVAVKNIYFIIECLKDLAKINNDFNMIFLGYGPEENKMKRQIKEFGLQDIVKFTGKITNEDEKAIILKNSNLMFFPSLYETDGLIKVEAACYEVPTLCIENTSLASVITDNKNGFVCKNDKSEIVQRLDFLIKNVDFVQKIGKNAKLDLYFTWEKPCEMLKNLYEEYFKKFHLKKMKKQEKIKSTNSEKTAQIKE